MAFRKTRPNENGARAKEDARAKGEARVRTSTRTNRRSFVVRLRRIAGRRRRRCARWYQRADLGLVCLGKGFREHMRKAIARPVAVLKTFPYTDQYLPLFWVRKPRASRPDRNAPPVPSIHSAQNSSKAARIAASEAVVCAFVSLKASRTALTELARTETVFSIEPRFVHAAGLIQWRLRAVSCCGVEMRNRLRNSFDFASDPRDPGPILRSN